MADRREKPHAGRDEVVAAAIVHPGEEEGHDAGPVELERLSFFASAQAQPASSERLVSTKSIEARVAADCADVCLAARDLVSMDEELLLARERLGGMARPSGAHEALDR